MAHNRLAAGRKQVAHIYKVGDNHTCTHRVAADIHNDKVVDSPDDIHNYGHDHHDHGSHAHYPFLRDRYHDQRTLTIKTKRLVPKQKQVLSQPC